MVTTRKLGTWNRGTKAREDRGPSTAVILTRGWGVGGSTRGGGWARPPGSLSEHQRGAAVTCSQTLTTTLAQKMVLIGYLGAMHPRVRITGGRGRGMEKATEKEG